MKVFQYQFITWLRLSREPDQIRKFNSTTHFLWNIGPPGKLTWHDPLEFHVVVQPGEVVFWWDTVPGMFAMRDGKSVVDFIK